LTHSSRMPELEDAQPDQLDNIHLI
jgi:hypothetical protein